MSSIFLVFREYIFLIYVEMNTIKHFLLKEKCILRHNIYKRFIDSKRVSLNISFNKEIWRSICDNSHADCLLKIRLLLKSAYRVASQSFFF